MAIKNQDQSKPDGFVSTVLFLIFEKELLPSIATGPRSEDKNMLFEIRVTREITNVNPELHKRIMTFKNDQKLADLIEKAYLAQIEKFKAKFVVKDEEKAKLFAKQQEELVKKISDKVFPEMPFLKIWG